MIQASLAGAILALGVFSAAGAHARQSFRKPGEILLKIDSDGTKAEEFSRKVEIVGSLRKLLGDAGLVAVKELRTDRALMKIRVSSDGLVDGAVAALRAAPGVKYAEPNYLRFQGSDGQPNDPEFSRLYGLHNTGQADGAGQVGTPGAHIDLLPVWRAGYHGSRSVAVAVVDTGMDLDHPDLAANLFVNAAESAGKSGVDDDGNGFVDDVHGWNFADKNNDPDDNYGHGSHCAGTIGAVGDNGKGVAGVNWEVSLMPVKFLGDFGGSIEDEVEAINYARLMKAQVISASFGGSESSEAELEAIAKAAEAGILVVAAAGNSRSDNDQEAHFPSSYDLPNIVSVAATDNRDALAPFSSYGAKSVHVAAPGVQILSTIPGGGYALKSGTSMATPHVSGIAALLLSIRPDLTVSDLRKRLIETSDPLESLRGKVVAQGRVNARRAVEGMAP